MIDQAGIRTQALRRYEEYLALLASGADGEAFFPVDIRFGKVRSGEASGRWSELREELRALRDGSAESGQRSYRIEWEERADRLAGIQRFPVRVYFLDADSLLAYLRKTEEASRFVADAEKLWNTLPALRPWAAKKPLRVVEHAGDWDRLIAVVQWLQKNPRPSIFAREVPAVEDTKFIERHKTILRELLDHTLGDEWIERKESAFELRYGFRKIEPLVRVAMLDRTVAERRLSGVADLSVPLSTLDRILFPEIETLIVFENKANFSNADAFLSLPSLRGCAAIFGSGFAAASLGAVAALSERRLFYWGDIDTQGFRILSSVRERFPSCRSILMDGETFDRFPQYRTDAPAERAEEPPALEAAELALYRRLASASGGNRLEQERIPLQWARERLRAALSSP